MDSIIKYSGLIKKIPTENQSTIVKRKNWEELLNARKEIEEEIFGDSEEIELSRQDVFLEKNVENKIVKTLMWGYPTGGRGNNIERILLVLEELARILEEIEGQGLTKETAYIVFTKFEGIKGLGVSTWSKLLFFFNVSIDSNRCQIYDSKVVDSLNKKQFSQLKEEKKWAQNNDDYIEYIDLLDDLSKKMSVRPEQVEVFLFYFNREYKFVMK